MNAYAHIVRNLKLLSGNLNVWIAIAAGLIYSSWPLGFMLNPFVAHHDFASDLESAHQPYAWLFITLDVLSGVLMGVAGIRQWRKSGRHITLRLSVVAYVLFGLLVIAAALAPYNCQSGTQSCQVLLHSPAFIIHGFSSIVSVVFLLVSLVLPTKLLLQKQMYRWLILLAVFILAGWGLTGLGTLIVIAHGMRSNWLQYDFITVCSLTMIGSLILVEHLSNHHAPSISLETNQDRRVH
jgi:hypothetical protein